MTTRTSGSAGGSVEDDSIDIALVRRIARTLDRDPTDLPPLAWEVDLDALRTLVTNGGVCVTFEYEGCEVRVGEDGDVEVVPLDASERSSPTGE